MSARWLLEEIVEELGEIPYNKFSDIFNQVVAQLIKTPRIIIVDETDYLTIDSRAVETLRDIHDKTDVPIVLGGLVKGGMSNHGIFNDIESDFKENVFVDVYLMNIEMYGSLVEHQAEDNQYGGYCL